VTTISQWLAAVDVKVPGLLPLVERQTTSTSGESESR
jgi:hypothetical protein